MASIDKFAVFILTHGRPDNVVTYRTLEQQGYTGKVYIIVDNEDDTVPKYRKRYGDKVIEFDKLAISKTFDTADNFDDRRTAVYARNASVMIAEDLGLDYFLELDDDYTAFVYKFDASLRYAERRVKDLDKLFSLMLEYYSKSDAVSIAFAQNGDFIGGREATFASAVKTKRKCMNTFFCSTSQPFSFVGRVNEDVNTYVALGHKGKLFLTVNPVAIIQRPTQSNPGGYTDVYLKEGTYRKSFYTVMFAPSCTTIALMGSTHQRLHHKINWNCAVPCIVDEQWQKEGDM